MIADMGRLSIFDCPIATLAINFHLFAWLSLISRSLPRLISLKINLIFLVNIVIAITNTSTNIILDIINMVLVIIVDAQNAGYDYFISFTAVTSWGRIFRASPTIPYWATSNIGASLSVFTATMHFDVLTPARCCVAPEIPIAI